MKNIVIFCDGTWNKPDEKENGVSAPTNVVRLAQAVAPADSAGTLQRLYYDAGIGSAGSWLRRTYDGATGAGIAENIIQAYTFLVRNFELGDRIFLFGFSRGAFTVRSLAGLIRNAGILERNALARVEDAFDLYRSRDLSTHPSEIGATLFRRSHAVQDITPIHFIGVWDTVGALGNPLLLGKVAAKNRFHDTRLSQYVQHAFHALAIDELRASFEPTLWEREPRPTDQSFEQRWFVGVHSDVGGGYAEHGLSDIPLDWLRRKAVSAGLEVGSFDLGKNPIAMKHESRKSFYRVIPKYNRPIGIDPIDPETNVTMETCQTIDESVWARRKADASYRPPALEDYLRRHPVRPPSVPLAAQ